VSKVAQEDGAQPEQGSASIEETIALSRALVSRARRTLGVIARRQAAGEGRAPDADRSGAGESRPD
jgi:hypothetical protein